MINIRRLLKSFVYAFRGLIKTFREEQNLRIQTTVAAIVMIAAYYFHISKNEWLVIILIIGIVILTEIINTAVELVTDVLKPRIDGYVKIIKDVMAAAVMMSAIIAVIIGIIIFWPYLFRAF